MSDLPKVERQLREVNTYNLFFSALTERADPSLASSGWTMPMSFGVVEDPYNDVKAEPDFVLYDGDIVLFVEIKSGNNIENRHIDQMKRCNALSIQGIEEELTDAKVQAKTPYDGSVESFDCSIVYMDIDEEYIEKCRSEWDNCAEQLEAMEEQAAVLTQDYGGALRKIAGQFESGRLERTFTEGISLPENPPEQFMLTEQMEKETLAIAICDIWGERILDTATHVETNVNEIRDFFAPKYNLPPQRVNRTLYYLTEVDACEHIDGFKYRFNGDHISGILGIVNELRKESVEDTLADVDEDHIPDEHQATLDMVDDETVANGLGEDDDVE